MANTTQFEIGSVVSLWRYPVKSMMGEELNATEVTERGVKAIGIRRSCPKTPLNKKGYCPSVSLMGLFQQGEQGFYLG